MAMVDKIPNVHTAEVHQQRDAGKWSILVAGPEGNLDHVRELAGNGGRLLGTVRLKVILRQHLEMNLVKMKLMVLRGLVLNGPLFDCALPSNNRWRVVVIEKLGSLSHNGNEELSGIVVLRESEKPQCSDGLTAQSGKKLGGICRGRRGHGIGAHSRVLIYKLDR